MLLSAYKKEPIEMGIDEVGRGAIAGPLVVAGVILPKRFTCENLKDSKKTTEKQRKELLKMIYRQALGFSISTISNERIEQCNIVQATILGIKEVVSKMEMKPEITLIDRVQGIDIEKYKIKNIVKGDEKFYSIAAASIIAKVYRDKLMQYWHNSFPFYQWNTNVGYPTQKHFKAIEKYGISPIHRKTFALYHRKN